MLSFVKINLNFFNLDVEIEDFREPLLLMENGYNSEELLFEDLHKHIDDSDHNEFVLHQSKNYEYCLCFNQDYPSKSDKMVESLKVLYKTDTKVQVIFPIELTIIKRSKISRDLVEITKYDLKVFERVFIKAEANRKLQGKESFQRCIFMELPKLNLLK